MLQHALRHARAFIPDVLGGAIYLYDPDRQRLGLRAVAGLGGVPTAISAHIVTQHGGQIEVESTEGQGATFRVVLLVHALAEPTGDGVGTGGGEI